MACCSNFFWTNRGGNNEIYMFGATAATQLLQRRRPRRLGYVRDVQPGRRAALEALPPVLALLSGNMSVHAVHAIRGPRAYPEGDTSCGACVSRVPCSQPASKTGRQACVGASCVCQSGERRECGVRCARAGGERRATARRSSATATTRTLTRFGRFELGQVPCAMQVWCTLGAREHVQTSASRPRRRG